MPSRVLLVEGVDDYHVLWQLCAFHGMAVDKSEIMSLGGDDRVLDNLRVRLKPGETGVVVGAILDADADLDARWRSVCGVLERAGYGNVPAKPDPAGTIVESPARRCLPRVGFWIMPDNASSGKVEDFVRFMVPAGDEDFDYAKQCVDGIPILRRRFKSADHVKAVLYTWLAWQETPGIRTGHAIARGYLDGTADEALRLHDWLNRLYVA